jgi:hypothetical protein
VVDILAVLARPAHLLCTLAYPIDPEAQLRHAECLRQAAETNAAQPVFWVVLWVGGLTVAGAFLLREITAARVPK